jgi:hypothetical protein
MVATCVLHMKFCNCTIVLSDDYVCIVACRRRMQPVSVRLFTTSSKVRREARLTQRYFPEDAECVWGRFRL